MSSPADTTAAAKPRPVFAHLHVHTEYSLTDGSIRVKKLLDRARTLGHTAVAITDHGVLFGGVDLYLASKDFGVKPIIGSEIFHAGTDATRAYAKEFNVPTASPDFGAFHLVLLSKSLDGYRSLINIVSHGYLDGLNPDGIPVTTLPNLAANAGAMVAMSSCLKGEFAWLIARLRACSEGSLDLGATEGPAGAINRALRAHVDAVHACVGVGNYYVELIDNNLPAQKALLPDLVTAARHIGLPLVASADAHYLDESYAETHAVLLAIKASRTMKHLSRRDTTARFHLLNNEEFLTVYAEWPEAIANTLKIADECAIKFEFGKFFLPRFPLPGGESESDGLARMAREMLEQRFAHLDRIYGPSFDAAQKQIYRDRLEFEIATINKMGFPGYFLIVQDFINWAKDHDIPVGPGRGSGAGSLVAYALRITDIDPLRFNLLFERFLNPERISMPDFDVDFCQDRRGEVIKYVTEKYGARNVAQITTFGKMLAKQAVKDVGRVLEMGYSRMDKISKMIPPKMPDGKGGQADSTIAYALEAEPRLREERDKDSAVSELLDTTARIQGLNRQVGIHAAGIVITDQPLTDYVPVYKTPEGDLVTQLDMKLLEKVGLVKFDFLGLKTLTTINHAVRMIREQVDPNFDIAAIPLDDPEVFADLSDANTVGVFQMEGRGLREILARLKPSKFEDIIAMVALYRPGPLGSGMVDSFIERKHGREEVRYPLPQLEDVLKETYGVILYQEQVMKVAQDLAKYSLGEADLLRRAMGKKKPEEMAAQKTRFLKGANENAIDPTIASDIFELMAKFAEYGFNKSHSAAYGLVAYQTAYLKTRFTEQFMAAAMTCDSDDTDKIVNYVQELRRLKFTLLPPDINHSDVVFTVPGRRSVDFSLGAIKGVGPSAVQPIVNERRKNGPFASLESLARRVDLRLVGKKTLELLATSGALDSFGIARNTLIEKIPAIFAQSEDHFNSAASGQRLLFGAPRKPSVATADAPMAPPPVVTLVPPGFDGLMREKKLLGTYLSGHPLDSFVEDMRCFGRIPLKDVAQWVDRESIALVGLMTKIDTKISKKTGAPMTFITLEDRDTIFEARYFPKAESATPLPPVDSMVVAFASVRKGFEEGTIRVAIQQVIPLESFRKARVRGLTINLPAPPGYGHGSMPPLDRLRALMDAHPGTTPIRLRINYPEAQVTVTTPTLRVDLCDRFMDALREMTPMVRNAEFYVG